MRGRVEALDGLRGVAILLVLIGHTRMPAVSGASLTGVTLFFVLSGYLITRLLVAEHASTGVIHLSGFFVRRAARLLPALVAFLTVITGWAAVANRNIVGEALRGLVSVQNLWIMHTGERGILDHTWSLSLEEQFYLLWPVLLLVLLRWRIQVVAWVAVAAVASFLLRIAVFDGSWLPVYFNPATSCFSLLAGCAIAWSQWRPPASITTAAVAVLGIMCIAPILIGATPASVLGPAASSLAAMVLVLAAAGGPVGDRGGRLPWLGRRSYAVYLWHYPLALLPPLAWIGFPVAGVIAAAASVGIAGLSWRWVEQPVQRLGTGAPSSVARGRTAYGSLRSRGNA